MGLTAEEVQARCDELHEFNPNDGTSWMPSGRKHIQKLLRCRQELSSEAAIEVKDEMGYDIVPEIMIPLVGEKKELKYVKDIVVCYSRRSYEGKRRVHQLPCWYYDRDSSCSSDSR